MDFKDQTVVVTGASGNLGRAVTQAFAEQGAQLVLIGRSLDELQHPGSHQGIPPLLLEADLTDEVQASGAIEAAVARFGRVDVLCNLAGGFRMGEPVHEASTATWDFLFDLNVRSVLHMARATVPHMLRVGGGKIVNVSAFAAQKGAAGMGAYAASKSAVIRLTESMSAELREQHINVNCVLPTIIDTPENRAAMPDVDPMRWVAPSALASVIVFLASHGARAIHGAALPVSALS
jgi:NAD(P)-dependent dehydrogenase (short-subunit alcohol dehydrogenase family)